MENKSDMHEILNLTQNQHPHKFVKLHSIPDEKGTIM